MTDDEADAIAFRNLKGPRDKALIETAEALRHWKSKPEYRSNASVGARFGVSGEIVREFLALLDLPVEVQLLLRERKLSLEQGRRLWQLSKQRSEMVREVAEAMTSLSVLDSRHLVEYVLKHPDLSLEQARRDLAESKTIVDRAFAVVAVLSEDQYRSLQTLAGKERRSVNDLVTDVVRRWIASVGRNDD